MKLRQDTSAIQAGPARCTRKQAAVAAAAHPTVENPLKTRTVAFVAGLALAGLATLSNAQSAPQDPPQQGQPGQREGGQRPQRGGEGGQGGERGPGGRGRTGGPNLEGAMKAMNGALKGLKANVGDASKKDECLKMVATFQYGCAASKAAPMPGNLGKDLDAAGKAKMEAKMRDDLRTMMKTAMALEDAILAGKADDAAKLVAQLESMRDAGHKEMGVKDD